MTTYQRLEEGNYKRFPYQQLVNCSIVLGVKLDALTEDKFKGWTTFRADAKEPPNPLPWKTHSRRPSASG